MHTENKMKVEKLLLNIKAFFHTRTVRTMYWNVYRNEWPFKCYSINFKCFIEHLECCKTKIEAQNCA